MNSPPASLKPQSSQRKMIVIRKKNTLRSLRLCGEFHKIYTARFAQDAKYAMIYFNPYKFKEEIMKPEDRWLIVVLAAAILFTASFGWGIWG